MHNERDQPLFSFAIVSDTHLTEEENLSFDSVDAFGSKLAATYDDLIARVNAMKPAFVVHLGDITDPVPVSPAFSDSAQAFHSASAIFDMPYYLVPGNHDVGEKLHPALPSINDQVSITRRAIEQYEQHFGRQRYSFEHGGCVFLVINTMLINSGLAEEREQWDWLNNVLANNAGERIFVFAHYPLYLSAKDEPDFYDNIDEPGRSDFIELLGRHEIEGYYAGHVHNFFYNNLNGMHQFVLPSTGIIRTDYMEFFRTPPTREMGSFDPAKLGFFWVDVYATGHVPYLIRAGEKLPFRAHSWNHAASTVALDLRIPWCDEADIPSAWGLEIFERKHVRNDYPLAALWEMGVTDLRIPISDLLSPRISNRVKELAALGHQFTVVMMGLPDARRCGALVEHAAGIKAIEVVALFEQWTAFIPPLKDLRDGAGFEIYLHAVRPEVEGWTTHHGLHTDLRDEIDWVLGLPGLLEAVDGFVFGIRREVAPVDGYAAVEQCLLGSNYKALLHVPCVRMFWARKARDDAAEKDELARVAEATLLARAHPALSIVIDNFVELDRGYCSCSGLVDRLYNPKDGSRIVTSLNAVLPKRLSNLASYQTNGARVVSAECDKGSVYLVLPISPAVEDIADARIARELVNIQGVAINLDNGEQENTRLTDLIKMRASDKTPQPPALLLAGNLSA